MDKKNTLSRVKEFISIESVSTDPGRAGEMEKACGFLSDTLKDLGFSVEILREAGGHPLVFARHEAQKQSKSTKTIGIYGHYDVQPEDPADEWLSPPFELTARNGKLYGRGIADDKGHVMQNLFALENLIKDNRLTNNIICIFEGEEETGSNHFEAYMKKLQGKVSAADMFFVTDMGMHAVNVPQIFYALRGIVYFDLLVKTGTRDLHSGIYGNAVLNPAQVAMDLITKMKDVSTGEIRIPGLYDSVRVPDEKELKLLEKTVRGEDELKREAGVERVMTVRGYSSSLVTKLLPSLDVNGMVSGYTGEGSKTVIPKEAKVKFSIRLVEHMEPAAVERTVKKFIGSHISEGVSFELNTLASESPFYTSMDHPVIRTVAGIMRDICGNPTLYNRSGGSVPAAAILQRLFGKPVILTGFTLPDDNIHAPNENFDEAMFEKGIEVLQELYKTVYMAAE